MYKKYFSKFIEQQGSNLHFAGHSHHYWPDITRQAQLEYWDDSASLIDDKWSRILGEKLTSTQRLISEVIGLSTPENICFAQNTHELLYRLISSFEKNHLKILSSDSEFYSFERQAMRFEESKRVKRTKVSTEEFETFESRFIKASKDDDYDLIFVSQVFFNSGNAIKDLNSFVKQLDSKATIVIDGYHGFMAIDTDISSIENEIFYLGGSYKYAASGEGCCFMTIPSNCEFRPMNTGWFAEMDTLANKPNEVQYAKNGMRFAGATLDFTPLYRLNSWLELMKKDGLKQSDFHQYVKFNQALFLKSINGSLLRQYLLTDQNSCGHFLAFSLPSSEKTLEMIELLKANKILTDSRKNVLRFGFTIYQSEEDILKCCEVINSIESI